MTEPGALGEEAARLLGAAQQWLHRVVLDPATAKVATGSPECCWCPLCQLIAASRGDRPELAERLSEAMAAMTALQGALGGLLRSVADSVPRTEPGTGGPGSGGFGTEGSGTEGSGAEPPARDVQRIDLSGEDG